MKKGQLVEARTPRGAVKRGRFVREVTTHNGKWLEIAPVDIETDIKIKNAETFRSRPASVTVVQ